MLLSLLTANIYAYRQPTGSWRTHISYNNTIHITQSDRLVYALSSGALYSISKDDLLTETYSRLTGLNDNTISAISYSADDKLLLIAYTNSNIDLLLDDGTIVNITDIYRKNTSSDKSIYNIYFHNRCAYLSCGLGVIKLNLTNYQIDATYVITSNTAEQKTISCRIENDTIYAATPNNIYYASTVNTNLQNYQNWHLFANPETGSANSTFTTHNGKPVVVKSNNKAYLYNNGVWEKIADNANDIISSNGMLFIKNSENHISVYNDNILDAIKEWKLTYALYDDKTNSVWVSSDNLIASVDLSSNEIRTTSPNGPATNDSWKLKNYHGNIYTIPGGRFATEYKRSGSISKFIDNNWENHTNSYLAENSPKKHCTDLVDIAVDPNDPSHYYVAAYGMGLYEFRNNEFYMNYNCLNSPIESALPPTTETIIYYYTRVEALNYDRHGNLWMSNSNGEYPLKYIDPSGEYHKLKYSDLNRKETIQDILFDTKNENRKFILLPRNKSSNDSFLFAIDDNGTIDDTSDDRTRGFESAQDQNDKEIKFSEYRLRCIIQDLDNAIWIGTTKGILLINNTDKIFDQNFRLGRVIIPRNDGTNLADYLLDTEEITAIAVDGANRKWIGTAASGLFLVSPDGQTTIEHFSTENSPILSDNITSIAINDATGEVFIGTANGIISYQSDAMPAGDKFENVHAYPNPLRPEHSCPITITGLTEECNVIITDVNGNTVYKTVSTGANAIWDATLPSGERVATGIYFAHCISKNGKDKKIVKMLIVN